jgi:hypothetical protein
MLSSRPLPSGALACELVNEARQTWSAESVPRDGEKSAHIRVSSPVDFELTYLTAGQMQQALAALCANLEMLKALERPEER